jgi:hypothetical protein
VQQSFSPSHLNTYCGHQAQFYTTATTTNHVVAPNAVIPTVITGPNATAAFTTSRVAAPAVILTEKQKKADAKKELDERRIAHIF